jgi:prolyl oligopeptidase
MYSTSRARSGSLVLLFIAACGGAREEPKAPPVAPPPATGGSLPTPPPAAFNDADLLYLEDVQGDKALAFARSHNGVSESGLSGQADFKALQDRLLAIYSSKEKIPGPSIENGNVRNFWTDADHQRGIWRQTTLAEYKKPEPKWTTLLDVDALNKAENESFVYHGADCLYPQERKCLVRLSKGGGDADIVREFDAEKKEFVKNGFVLPEAKHSIAWKDDNTVYVGTNFGAGSLTKSGYPRIVKEWKRGTPIGDAVTIFEVKDSDIRADCWRSFDHDKKRDFCMRAIDFEHREMNLRDAAGKLAKIEKPEDADAGFFDDDILLRLRSDWTVGSATHKKGSLLTSKLKAFMDGKREFQVLFEPTKNSSLSGYTGTKNLIVTNALTDVKNQVTVYKRPNANAPWVGTPFKESIASIRVGAFDENKSDDAWLWLEDFTIPSSLELWSVATGKREPLKKMPSFFESKDLEVVQHFSTSKDGTKIPYFEVSKKGRTGAGPTVVEAYGGFEISMSPSYRAGVGAAWLEKGGTYVLANLRGGGEYGPAWHEAAMKHNRQKAYDDLISVAEDLIKRGVATTKTLGVMGGSNGGLLTSVMLTQRPDLWGAVVSKVPLTDMQRFHKLLAGASWMSEYGDPDKAEDWAALQKFSPLHNIKNASSYPPVFYTTSTKDDRVHPGHARKMVAKLEAMGAKPLYYENIEGGHGGAADIKQRAYVDALVYTFLWTRLSGK